MNRLDVTRAITPYRAPTPSDTTPAGRSYRELRKRLRKHAWSIVVYAGMLVFSVHFVRDCIPAGRAYEKKEQERVDAHARDCNQFRNTPQRDIPGRCLSYYLPSR